MGYFVGIDLGSTAIKTVFVKDGSFAWYKAVPTAPGQERLAKAVMEEGLATLGASLGDEGDDLALREDDAGAVDDGGFRRFFR